MREAPDRPPPRDDEGATDLDPASGTKTVEGRTTEVQSAPGTDPFVPALSAMAARLGNALTPGAFIADRYVVEAILGCGGMGAVFSATDRGTGKKVALKAPHVGRMGAEAAKHRLRREASSASAARHANVVDVLDLVELEDGTPVLVMELLEGESLQQSLDREDKLPLAAAAALFLGVVAGVRAAHAAGVVHCDLKPDNVFLANGPGGTLVPKLVDFGIARLWVAASEREVADRHNPAGTPAYMSPEQAFNQTDLDGRADIWSLGMTLYETLSGVLPRSGHASPQTLFEVFMRPLEPLSALVPGLPESLSRLVERMLAVRREDRLSDLAEVEAILSRYAKGE